MSRSRARAGVVWDAVWNGRWRDRTGTPGWVTSSRAQRPAHACRLASTRAPPGSPGRAAAPCRCAHADLPGDRDPRGGWSRVAGEDGRGSHGSVSVSDLGVTEADHASPRFGSGAPRTCPARSVGSPAPAAGGGLELCLGPNPGSGARARAPYALPPAPLPLGLAPWCGVPTACPAEPGASR